MDLEKLIIVKRQEIAKEKVLLGLSPPLHEAVYGQDDDKENIPTESKVQNKRVNFAEQKALSEHNERNRQDQRKRGEEKSLYELEESIPPDLERYIRRYVGLPVMLRAGEYSPNNPLVRGERPTPAAAAGDAFAGLGDYERRRNTLRRIRQHQYREYLDEQAKKKQEAKEQAERERREREERERELEERERERERERTEREAGRRASYTCGRELPADTTHGYSRYNKSSKVDMGVQAGGVGGEGGAGDRSLSVAVQTDEADLFPLSSSSMVCKLTEAERELSPRTVLEAGAGAGQRRLDSGGSRRRSYGDCEARWARGIGGGGGGRARLASEPRPAHRASILDADAIHLRNLQAEEEAARRRQFYQQELRDQIAEQQRIREERRAREKMLEQAEMRRLEEQLRMLRAAQEHERGRHAVVAAVARDNATAYEKKRTDLQREIELENRALLRAAARPARAAAERRPAQGQVAQHNLPFCYPSLVDNDRTKRSPDEKQPYSANIPDDSIFSANYDVDSYLRKNLNPTKESMRCFSNTALNNDSKGIDANDNRLSFAEVFDETPVTKGSKEKELFGQPTKLHDTDSTKRYEPAVPGNQNEGADDAFPLPILRHSPKNAVSSSDKDGAKLSDAMRVVEDKWQVPAVQKNILKSIPNEKGKNMNILTQLGSIRRQLQLEQLKLDQMLTKNDECPNRND